MAATTAAVVGAAASVGSAISGRNAAKSATAAQERAAREGIAFQRETRDLVREDLAPFTEFGGSSIDPFQNLLTDEGQADFLNTNPIIAAARNNLNTQTAKIAASRGRLAAGDTSQQFMDNEILAALPILQNRQNNLLNAINIGQNSAAGQGNAALSTGNNITDLITGRGNAQAAGSIAKANATQQGVSDVVSLIPTLADAFKTKGQPNNA
jgi:hypothetical protein